MTFIIIDLVDWIAVFYIAKWVLTGFVIGIITGIIIGKRKEKMADNPQPGLRPPL